MAQENDQGHSCTLACRFVVVLDNGANQIQPVDSSNSRARSRCSTVLGRHDADLGQPISLGREVCLAGLEECFSRDHITIDTVQDRIGRQSGPSLREPTHVSRSGTAHQKSAGHAPGSA